VRAAFAARNVAVLTGDWTRGDAAITALLRAQGRDGVPLYLLYPPGEGAPALLPQILTEGALREALGSHPGCSAAQILSASADRQAQPVRHRPFLADGAELAEAGAQVVGQGARVVGRAGVDRQRRAALRPGGGDGVVQQADAEPLPDGARQQAEIGEVGRGPGAAVQLEEAQRLAHPRAPRSTVMSGSASTRSSSPSDSVRRSHQT
jgi:hypothetical protein